MKKTLYFLLILVVLGLAATPVMAQEPDYTYRMWEAVPLQSGSSGTDDFTIQVVVGDDRVYDWGIKVDYVSSGDYWNLGDIRVVKYPENTLYAYCVWAGGENSCMNTDVTIPPGEYDVIFDVNPGATINVDNIVVAVGYQELIPQPETGMCDIIINESGVSVDDITFTATVPITYEWMEMEAVTHGGENIRLATMYVNNGWTYEFMGNGYYQYYHQSYSPMIPGDYEFRLLHTAGEYPYFPNFLIYGCNSGTYQCATVEDPGFDFYSTDVVSNSWTLDLAATITDSILTLGEYEDGLYGPGIAWQEIDRMTTYTVTFSARAMADEEGDPGILGLSFNNVSSGNPFEITTGAEQRSDTAVISVTTQTWDTYTVTLTTAWRADDTPGLVLLGGMGIPVQLDWICMEIDGGNLCTYPEETIYNYDNHELQAWQSLYRVYGFDYPSDFANPQYEFFNPGLLNDDWVNGDGGWHSENGVTPAQVNSIVQLLSGGLQTAIGFAPVSLITWGATLSSLQADLVNGIILISPENSDAILNEIGLDLSMFGVDRLIIDVSVMVDDQMISVGSYVEDITSAYYTPHISMTLTQPPQAGRYIVQIGYVQYSSALFNKADVWLTGIDTLGCGKFSTWVAGECGVLDPSLDEGIDGMPSNTYWDYDPAIAMPGYVSLAAEAGDNISQKLFMPPGNYQIEIDYESTSSTLCQIGVAIDDASPTLIDCTPYTSSTVRSRVTIPIQPFTIKFTAEQGTVNLHRVCITLPGRSCINQNADFSQGLAYFETDGTQYVNGVLLMPGTQIKATGVQYTAGVGPWIVEVEASPYVTGTNVAGYITPGTLPEYGNTTDKAFLLTGTQTITYMVTRNEDTQELMIQSLNGPSVIDFDTADSMLITNYCVMTAPTSLWYGGKNCTLLVNADFLEGLEYWNSAGQVYGGAGWAKFQDGTINQSADMANLLLNGGFEDGVVTGWTTFRIYRAAIDGYVGGGARITIVSGYTSGKLYQLLPRSVPTALGCWIRSSNASSARVEISTGSGDVYSTYHTGGGDWEWLTVTANTSAEFRLRVDGAAGTYADFDQCVVVEGSSIPDEYITPKPATLHWIARSPGPSPVEATAIISTATGIYTKTHQFSGSGLGDEYFDVFEAGADVQVMVVGDEGVELDYVCVYDGEYSGPGDPEDPGDPIVWTERCAQPPNMILTDTLDAWIPTIWPEMETPDNLTTLTAYIAGNVRYIACFITLWAQKSTYQGDQIIVLLQAIRDQLIVGNILEVVGVVAIIVAMILLGNGGIVDTIAELGEAIVGGGSIIVTLILLVPAVLLLIVLIVQFIRLLLVVGPVFAASLYEAFRGTTGMTLIPDTSDGTVLGYVLWGMKIFDLTAGQTYLQPFVVLLLALASFGIFIWTINEVSKWSTG